VPETLPSSPVSADTRRNVFLVVKEALHNIVKYASATEVIIDAELREQSLNIRIQDNGKGFDLASNANAGNGLGNMKKRMADVGGTLSIESEPGSGTAVRLSVNV